MNSTFLATYGIVMTTEEMDEGVSRVVWLTGEATPQAYEEVS